MLTHSYITIPVLSIIVPADRARSLDADWANVLARMFADHGNKTAIEVRKDENGEGYVLVSGLHRLEAAKIAGWNEMEVKLIEASNDKSAVEYRLHEVIENIGRRELTILDRAHHLFEFQKAYEALHPELKKGGNKQTELSQDDRTAILALRQDVAEKAGLSDRSIQRAIQLWKALSKATRERVDGTWLADHQAGLMGLAAVGAKQQAKILDIIDDPENGVKSVADAFTFVEQGRLATSAERRIGGLRDKLTKLDDTTFDHLMDLNADRVEAWLQRRGAK
jgi:ParB family chromosome partitioning protein